MLFGSHRPYSETADVLHVQPVILVPTTSRTGGRPRKLINTAFLRTAMSAKRKISVSRLARLIGVHRHTLRKYLRLYNVDYSFSTLPDGDLDKIVRAYRQSRPESGIRYLVGFLRSRGLRIQKARVISSISRVDPLGRVLHGRTAIRRRKYEVARPNSLWHLDGHHKLIRWGIVVHGIADGYDRTVCFFYHDNSGLKHLLLSTDGRATGEHQQPFADGPRAFPGCCPAIWAPFSNKG